MDFISTWFHENADIVFWITIGLSFLCYIAALIFVKKGWMVFTTSKVDVAFLLISPVLTVIGELIRESSTNKTIAIVILSIAGILFLGSLAFSVFYNWNNGWGLFLSVMAKIFVFWLTAFITVLVIALILVWVVLTIASKNSERADTIVLHYDRALGAYVGYHVQ